MQSEINRVSQFYSTCSRACVRVVAASLPTYPQIHLPFSIRKQFGPFRILVSRYPVVGHVTGIGMDSARFDIGECERKLGVVYEPGELE